MAPPFATSGWRRTGAMVAATVLAVTVMGLLLWIVDVTK
jgi:hypothetical protein